MFYKIFDQRFGCERAWPSDSLKADIWSIYRSRYGGIGIRTGLKILRSTTLRVQTPLPIANTYYRFVFLFFLSTLFLKENCFRSLTVKQNLLSGAVVKRLRYRPFTAMTPVRIRSASLWWTR